MDEEIELGAEEARAANGRAASPSSSPLPPTASVKAVPNPAPDASRDDRVAKLEAELADWQRRAVLWRERALNVQALNEVLTQNLDDLRAVLRLTSPPESAPESHAESPPEEGDRDQPGQLQPRPKSGFEQWKSRVFSRENWTTKR